MTTPSKRCEWAVGGYVKPAPLDYETVAAGQTDQVLGRTGAEGDYLDSVIVTVATSASGTSSVKDGSGSAIPLTAANTPIGVYVIKLGISSTGGAWSATTGAGATVVATGFFTEK